MLAREYLLSYGHAGEFGRFNSEADLLLRRGDRAVIESVRGLELGNVLRPTLGGEHQHLLQVAPTGKLIRLASRQDGEQAERMRKRGEHLFAASRRAATQLQLPLEVLDVEVLLDGRKAWLHYLRSSECDPRPLMDALSEEFELQIIFHDLALAVEHEESTGCGSGSGSCGSGGCGSCSSGGCGSCSHGNEHDDHVVAGRVSLA